MATSGAGERILVAGGAHCRQARRSQPQRAARGGRGGDARGGAGAPCPLRVGERRWRADADAGRDGAGVSTGAAVAVAASRSGVRAAAQRAGVAAGRSRLLALHAADRCMAGEQFRAGDQSGAAAGVGATGAADAGGGDRGRRRRTDQRGAPDGDGLLPRRGRVFRALLGAAAQRRCRDHTAVIITGGVCRRCGGDGMGALSGLPGHRVFCGGVGGSGHAAAALAGFVCARLSGALSARQPDLSGPRRLRRAPRGGDPHGAAGRIPGPLLLPVRGAVGARAGARAQGVCGARCRRGAHRRA
eukprot:ctg_2387.g573